MRMLMVRFCMYGLAAALIASGAYGLIASVDTHPYVAAVYIVFIAALTIVCCECACAMAGLWDQNYKLRQMVSGRDGLLRLADSSLNSIESQIFAGVLEGLSGKTFATPQQKSNSPLLVANESGVRLVAAGPVHYHATLGPSVETFDMRELMKARIMQGLTGVTPHDSGFKRMPPGYGGFDLKDEPIFKGPPVDTLDDIVADALELVNDDEDEDRQDSDQEILLEDEERTQPGTNWKRKPLSRWLIALSVGFVIGVIALLAAIVILGPR